MKYGKKFAVAAVATLAVLSLAGCSTGKGDTPAADGGDGDTKDMSIELVSKGFQHQFWQAVKKGAEEQGKELGVKIHFDGPGSETEIEKQLQMLQSAIDAKPDAIAYAALDPEACIPLMDSADSAGIPVAYFDAPCNSEVGKTLAATDSKVAGALAAEHMAELIGGKGDVAIVAHSQINSTGVERRDGFVDKIKADYPDIKIVDIQYGDGDHLKSADITKSMLNAHPDLKGIYATNEGSAVGVANALSELGKTSKDITAIGFDSGAAQVDAIKSGVLAGAITQDPIGIGKTVVQAAYDLANGKSVEEFYDTGSYWYDSTNLDDPKIAAVLYE
ncbi:ABC transporter substrate-binding protein [Microbacterium sp. KUDC0406]|uniref:ABC transporter substrate-binding protein n=1 Tax=Microbacterium sp. KUDC0406 TaxID=2909588 RepID=UPI001F433536|nr:ABC transporter substrate-binding protein [Microbacterium sp. KUDC0406]UJP09979.1 ABC transporter substrate-binding protein [Microbacterium sp. KUDC0406]